MKKSIMLLTLSLLFNTAVYGENQSKAEGQALLHQYLPKECYKSVKSSGTIYAESWAFGEVNINNEKFTQFDTPDSARLEKNGTVTYRGETCSSSDLEIFFANKPGYVKSLSNCDSQSITYEMPPQGSALMSQRLYCEGYGDDFYNIKIVNYEGRDVLYAESTSPKGKSKLWHNLEPFHLIKRTSTWSGENGHGFNTWIWTDVKINEPIDEDVFIVPDTPPDNSDNPYTGIACTATGIWYDPDYSGSGFNLINTPMGYGMYFYGYKDNADGEPLWLVSAAGPTKLSIGKAFELPLYSGFAGNGGSFTTKPTGTDYGIKKWGTARINFTSETTGVITLTGKDGTVSHNIQRLASVQGLDCSGVIPTEKRFSVTGVWYDPAYAGSGFNIVNTTTGYVMYFYGYKGSANGEPLWLVSDIGAKTIVKGKTYKLPVYSSYSGNGASFSNKPTGTDYGIKKWGMAEFTFNSCNQGVITLTGRDGMITHNIVRLAGVNAFNCSE